MCQNFPVDSVYAVGIKIIVCIVMFSWQCNLNICMLCILMFTVLLTPWPPAGGASVKCSIKVYQHSDYTNCCMD